MNDKQYTLEQLRQVKGIGKKTVERIEAQFDDSEYVSKYNPELHIEPNSLINGDMLEVMNGIPDKSVDMILTDLPYGTTTCGWDTIIPFDKLWKQYNRVIKDNGAIVLFGSEPFSTRLRMSNIDNYKYDWIWKKNKAGNFALCKKNPMKYHENIMVFYKGFPVYNLWKLKALDEPIKNSRSNKGGRLGHCHDHGGYVQTHTGFHETILDFKSVINNNILKHPTQKPTELLEYLIKTYTNENEIVLDSTMGSGSTCVAAKNTNRKYIGIELEKEYYEIAKKRIEQE